jgi:hypothetical protein
MVSLLLALLTLVAPMKPANVVGPVGGPAPQNVVGPVGMMQPGISNSLSA